MLNPSETPLQNAENREIKERREGLSKGKNEEEEKEG